MRPHRSSDTAPVAGQRNLPLYAGGAVIGCCAVAVALALHPARADAAGTISCTPSGRTLHVSVSGTGSDSLLVTTSGGSYQINFDGGLACTDSDSLYQTVHVADTGSVPAVFEPGTDTNVAFDGPGAATTLDLSAAPAGTRVTLNGDTPASRGSVPWKGGTDLFSGVSAFTGSSAGSATFAAGSAGGYTFTGSGSGNTLDLSAATAGVDVSVPAGTVTGLTGGSDSFSGITTFDGSGAGGNTFAAGPGSETFRDTGTAGGDTVDFSQVSSALAVNVSGTTQGGVLNDTATAGPATYAFSLGAHPSFTGSPGATTFYAGSAGGYGFTGKGTSTTLDLSAAPSGVDVSVPAGTVTGLTGGSDSISGITTFDGSPGGSTTFTGGSAGGYTFTGNGAGNTLDLSAAAAGVDVSVPAGTVTGLTGGSDSFSGITTFDGSGAGGNTFAAGPGSETFRDTGTAGGDTVDFSQVSSALAVNVSGTTQGGVLNDTATAGPATYAFSLGAHPSFTGSPGATTFYAGSAGGYGFTGKGTSTTLDLSAAPSGVDVSVPAGTVTGLTGGSDSIAGIATFTGSVAGGNTFAAGPDGGYTFTGDGSGNTLDLSAAGPGISVAMNGDSLASPGVVSNLAGGLGGATSDEFSSIASVRLPPTSTKLSTSRDPSKAGVGVTYKATVSPVPTGGTVGFTDNGSPVSGARRCHWRQARPPAEPSHRRQARTTSSRCSAAPAGSPAACRRY